MFNYVLEKTTFSKLRLFFRGALPLGATAFRLFLASLCARVSFARVSISWLFGGGVQKGDLGSKMKPEPGHLKPLGLRNEARASPPGPGRNH